MTALLIAIVIVALIAAILCLARAKKWYDARGVGRFASLAGCTQACTAGDPASCCSVGGKKVMCPGTGCCDQAQPGDSPCQQTPGPGPGTCTQACTAGDPTSCCNVGGKSVMCPGTGCCDQAQPGDSPCRAPGPPGPPSPPSPPTPPTPPTPPSPPSPPSPGGCSAPCSAGDPRASARCCLVGGKKVMCPGTGCCDQAQPGDSPCDLCANARCPAGQTCDPSTGDCRTPKPAALTVANHCPNDVVLRYVSSDPGLPGLTRLPSRTQVAAQIPVPSRNGRVYFYPAAGANTSDNGESSYGWWEFNNTTEGVLGGNISYVDHIAVPYSYRLSGGNCAANDKAVCATPLAALDIAGECPPDLLTTASSGEKMCLAPRTYCTRLPNGGEGSGDPRCDSSVPGIAQDLMNQLKRCCAAGKCTRAQCGPKVRPIDIWGCEGPFANDSPRCSMLQRGLFAPGSGRTFEEADDSYLAHGCSGANAGLYECQSANYYEHEPYNDYCKWVHSAGGCPGNYCQPYDDQDGLGGYHACRPTEVRIDLCEGDAA